MFKNDEEALANRYRKGILHLSLQGCPPVLGLGAIRFFAEKPLVKARLSHRSGKPIANPFRHHQQRLRGEAVCLIVLSIAGLTTRLHQLAKFSSVTAKLSNGVTATWQEKIPLQIKNENS